MASFFKRILPASVYQKSREFFLFRHDDPNKLIQQVPQMHVDGLGVDRIKGYRFPAPGSQVQPSVPVRNSDDELFDVTHFAKDSRNVPFRDDIVFNTTIPRMISAKEERPAIPANRKPRAKYDYDPTGLRTAKAVSYEAMDASIANFSADHCPKPAWGGDLEQMMADAKRKGIPMPVGKRYVYKNTPEAYYKVSW